MTKKELEEENKGLLSELHKWNTGVLELCGTKSLKSSYDALIIEHKKLKDKYIEAVSKLVKYIR